MSSVGVWVLISFVCIAFGILSLLHQFYISMCSVVVPGTVIKVVSGSYRTIEQGRTIGNTCSTVSFQPRGSAQPVTVEIPYGSGRPVGSQVQVIYLPGKLRSARFYTKESVFDAAWRWIQPCLLLGLGLLMASITVLPLLGINLW